MEITKEMKIGAEAIITRKNELMAKATTYGELLNLMEIGETVTPAILCERYKKIKENFLAVGGNTYWVWAQMRDIYINPAYIGHWAKAMEKAGYLKREKKSIEPYTIKRRSVGFVITEPQNCFEVEDEITIDTQMYYTRIK